MPPTVRVLVADCLTSGLSGMLISEADVTRARRAELVDKAAAAYILQGALDRIAV